MSNELSSMRAHDQGKKPMNICLHNVIPRSFIHLVDFSSRLRTSRASVVDHSAAFRAFSLKELLCQCKARGARNTYTSNRPPTSIAFCINISISDAIVTSAWTYIAFLSPYRWQINSWVGIVASLTHQVPRGEVRMSEQTIGEALLAAKARAMARPRPEEEPVTMVTRESRRVETRGVVMIEERGTVECGTKFKS